MQPIVKKYFPRKQHLKGVPPGHTLSNFYVERGTMRAALMASVTTAILAAAALSASPAKAQKPVIGIASIETAAQNISCQGWQTRRGGDCNQSLSEGFRVMLETAIVKSRKMDVMERTRLSAVLQEQLLGQAGVTTSGGEIGGLTGVDYLVYGTITKFGARSEETIISGNRGVATLLDDALQGALGDALGSATLTTEMAVDLKVTDVITGQIVLAETIEGSSQQGKSVVAGGVALTEVSGDPFADVQRVVAARLSESIVTSRIPFKIIQIQSDGTVILNYGDVFLKPGDQLALFDLGEQFVDPDTGEVLGAEETQTGVVQVVAAETKFSKGVVLESSKSVAAGNILRRIATPPADEGPAQRERSGGRF